MITTISEFLQNTPIFSWQMISILIGVGIFVGFINTMAGMATAITYALFMSMGLPINVANGTIRIGVAIQFGTTSLIFKRKGYLKYKQGGKVGLPVALGSIIGAELAATLHPIVMEWAMGILLPLVAILLFIDPRKLTKKEILVTENMNLGKFLMFVLIGIYGGFTHAGVGLLIIFGSFYMLGLDLIRSNAIKQFAVLMYTPIAVCVFILHGQINWPIAFIYAIGNTIGGIIGARTSIKCGEKAIKRTIAIVIFIISFWLIYKQFV